MIHLKLCIGCITFIQDLVNIQQSKVLTNPSVPVPSTTPSHPIAATTEKNLLPKFWILQGNSLEQV